MTLERIPYDICVTGTCSVCNKFIRLVAIEFNPKDHNTYYCRDCWSERKCKEKCTRLPVKNTKTVLNGE